MEKSRKMRFCGFFKPHSFLAPLEVNEPHTKKFFAGQGFSILMREVEILAEQGETLSQIILCGFGEYETYIFIGRT